MTEPLVTIPRNLLIQALTKARLLYIGACEERGQDPGDDDECWAQFEALAEYVGSTDDLTEQGAQA